MKTIIYKIPVLCLVLLLFLAIPGTAVSQETTQLRSTTSVGAGWSAGGSYNAFGIAGQYAVKTTFDDGSGYTGSIGFLFTPPPASVENLPPVAISPSVATFYEQGTTIELDGFDPELQPIEFEVITGPQFGSLVSLDPEINREFVFEPSSNLEPDVVYRDTVEFRVLEKNSALESGVGTFAFRFSVEDQPHEIESFTVNGNAFTLAFEDGLFNDVYGVDLNYYDLTDPTNPEIVNFLNGSVEKSQLTIDGSLGSYTFDVDEVAHDYLLTADQVLVTVLVSTENGYSSFESYIIDNTNGRVGSSEDGKFFIIGSEQSVPENKTVLLKMIAVDFTDVDVSASTFEWLSAPLKGSVGNVTVSQQSDKLMVWEAEYTSTEDVGGTDSFEFQVFSPLRNEFLSALVNVEIRDVNDLPKLEAVANQQMNEDGTLDVNLIYSDPDNELNVFATSSESDLTTDVVNGVLQLTGQNDFSGQAKINVWVEEIGTAEEYLRLKTFTVSVVPVNDPPVIQQVSNLSAEEDNTINVALSATDPDTDFQIFQYSATLDDPSLAFVEIDGSLLKIIPYENKYGTVNVSVTANDGSGAPNAVSNVMSFTAEFTPVNDPPSIDKQLGSQVLVQDFPGYTIDLSAHFSDPETDASSLIYSVANNTSVQLAFNNSTATVTLAGGFSGVEDIDIIASDGDESAIMTVTFVVNSSSPDVIVSNTVGTINLNEDFGAYTLDVSSVFEDINDSGAAFEYDLVGVGFLTSSIDDAANEITFFSKTNYSGTESVVLIGTSGGISTFTTFDIVTQAVNDAPVLQMVYDQSVKEDATLNNLLISVVDVDTDFGDLSLSITSDDQTIVADGNITISTLNGFYVADVQPEDNANGLVTLTMTASDGSLDDTGTFRLEVVAVNDLPENIASISDADEDVLKTIDVSTLYQDLDGDQLTFEVENLPSWLTQSGNIVSGTPTNDEVGISQMTVTAFDAGGETRNTFSFNVNNTNDAPILKQSVGATTTFSGQEFSYSVPEGNFEDVDEGDILTFTIEDAPAWASVSGSTLTGTPADSDAGTYMITFRATDVDGESVTDVLSVTVEVPVYEAIVVLSADEVCSGSTSVVMASGAFEYNWYDENDNLLQLGGSTYESQPEASIKLFVEGVDGQGNVTAQRFEIEVVVNPTPDVTITGEETFSVLQESGTTYQWYFNGEEIVGATNASYTPEEEGEYYVIALNSFGCEATSSSVTFTPALGVDDFSIQIDLYPIPSSEWLNITSDEDLSRYEFRVIGLEGKDQLVISTITGDEARLDIRSLKSGVYFLQLIRDDEVSYRKFVKK
ncbi:MAG: Ig-like domain-containing protein [Cyclobacteriaceae bacterium]